MPHLLIAATLLLVLAQSAAAGTVSREDRGAGVKLYYVSDPGEADGLYVGPDFQRTGALRFAGMNGKPAPRPGPGCSTAPETPQAPAYASCPLDGVTGIELALADGDDDVGVDDAVSVPVFAAGGDGNDSLSGGAAADFLDGGTGDDHLSGGPGADQLLGREGNDHAQDRDSSVDKIDCGLGEDTVEADFSDQLNLCEPTLPDVLGLMVGLKKAGKGFRVTALRFGRFRELSGITLRVRCAGRGCPFRARGFAYPPGRRVQQAFRGRVLARGSSLDFRLLRRGWYGRGARLKLTTASPLARKFCTTRDGRSERGDCSV